MLGYRKQAFSAALCGSVLLTAMATVRKPLAVFVLIHFFAPLFNYTPHRL
jgi:hypothetical protein